MSEEEELWDRNLREMEGKEERKRRKKEEQLALEDGHVESEELERNEEDEREEPSGSRDVPARGTKRMLALMDRQRVKPTSRTKKVRPTRAPQRDVMLRRIQELQDMAAKAKSARAGLLQQDLAKVKANPKIKAKVPKKAKAKEPEAKAKGPEAKAKVPEAKAKVPEAKAKDAVVPKGKDPTAAPKTTRTTPWRAGPPPAKRESAKVPPKKASSKAPPKELPKAKDLPAKAMPKGKEPPKTKARARRGTIYPDAPWHQRDDQEWYDYREWSNWKDWKNDRGW